MPAPLQKTEFSLSQEEVSRLISEPSPQSRIGVLSKVAFEYHSGRFEARELAVAEQIFRLLLKDTEVKVREALAQNLKDNANIPRDIILSMCKDVEQVALPVIRASQVLSDSDVIEIIRNSANVNHAIAVAERKEVSPRVSSALVETGKQEVVSKLIENPGAKINDAGYRQILEDFSHQEEIMSSLAGRASLPITIAEKLATLVSGKLGEQLEKKYRLGDTKLAFETEQSRELATLRMLETNSDPEALEKLIGQLLAHQRLTPSIIMTALCRGNIAFFEMALAKLSCIPSANARILINDKGELGFRALYAKAELPESMFAAVRTVLKVVKMLRDEDHIEPGTPHYANRLVEKLLGHAEDQGVGNLSYIIALIRQNVNHTHAPL